MGHHNSQFKLKEYKCKIEQLNSDGGFETECNVFIKTVLEIMKLKANKVISHATEDSKNNCVLSLNVECYTTKGGSPHRIIEELKGKFPNSIKVGFFLN